MPGLAPIAGATTSFIAAATIKHQSNGASETGGIEIGELCGIYTLQDTQSAMLMIGTQITSAEVPLSPVNTNTNILAAYDATTDIGRIWVNGSLAYTSARTVQPSMVMSGILIDASSLSQPLNAANLHAIKFVDKPLPANMSALAAAFHANPGQKLSAWAV